MCEVVLNAGESNGLLRYTIVLSRPVSRPTEEARMFVSRTMGPRRVFVGTINAARQLISGIRREEEVPKGSRRDQTGASLTVKMILAARSRSDGSPPGCSPPFLFNSSFSPPSSSACVPFLSCPSGRPFIRILPNISGGNGACGALSDVHNGARRRNNKKAADSPHRKGAR